LFGGAIPGKLYFKAGGFNMKKEKLGLVVKITIYHIATYIVCGMFFSTVLNYKSVWDTGIFPIQMRDYDSIFTFLGPAFQVFRGLLFAGILFLIPGEFFMTKFAWLKTWAVIAGLGIINTPGPAPGSIEGFIYTVTPLKTLVYCIEIYVQTLWFSVLVCRAVQQKKFLFWKKFRFAVLTAAAVFVSVMISGIVLSVLLKADIAEAGQDIGAVAALLVGAVLTFFLTRFYEKSPSKIRLGILLAACFIAGGVMPTVYNYITLSPFRTPLTLINGLVSTGLAVLIVKPIISQTKIR
jgi:hypothetical protein